MGDGLTTRVISPPQNRAHSTLQVCSTLSEWEHIAERFGNATHYSEKALYKLLKNHIVPTVVAELQVGIAITACLFVPLNPFPGT